MVLNLTALTKVCGWMPNCWWWRGKHEQEASYSAKMLMLLLHIQFLTVVTPEKESSNEVGVEGNGERMWGAVKGELSICNIYTLI